MNKIRVFRIRPLPIEAVCIGCSDSKACFNKGKACHWLIVDRERELGVCSNCAEFRSKFQ